ncbi:MAG: SAM hydrolase/SAM-dependent halogenase family protein [Thermodesulfobacteriota bacterium]
MTQILTLTTDFGLNDYYIGVVKGVILSINPDIKLVDINHNIKPYDIFGAAINIKKSYSYFPIGTIHMVVVDPGVGSERVPIIVKTDKYYFVGPDNGVFTFIYKEKSSEVYKISNKNYFLKDVSASFHARDIFAPVSAHLSLLHKPELFGEKINTTQKIVIKKAKRVRKRVIGEVVYIDYFGNMVTNIRSDEIGSKYEIEVGGVNIGKVSKSYSSVKKNQLVAIYGSSGFLEIAEYQGRAVDKYNGKPSIEILIK